MPGLMGRASLGRGHALWLPNTNEWLWNASYSTLAERAAAAHRGIWNPTYCGRGPEDAAQLKVTVNGDADGDDGENVNGEWFVVTASGRLGVSFAERNPFGVLDHEVTLPTGEVISVPMRVVPDGDGSEVVLSLRRQAGVSDEDFARDAGIVQSDLTRLKQLLEAAG